MIFLSATLGTGSPSPDGGGYRPALWDDYRCPYDWLDAPKPGGRAAVLVPNPPAALLIDPKYPQLGVYPYGLADYRAALHAACRLKTQLRGQAYPPGAVVAAIAAAQTAADLDGIDPTRIPRTLFAIRADLVALTGAQKTNVWNALVAGSPPLWATDAGPNAAALAVLQLLGASATLPAADVLESKIRAAAMYAQDNPKWLVQPSFDPSINVSGDQPA